MYRKTILIVCILLLIYVGLSAYYNLNTNKVEIDATEQNNSTNSIKEESSNKTEVNIDNNYNHETFTQSEEQNAKYIDKSDTTTEQLIYDDKASNEDIGVKYIDKSGLIVKQPAYEDIVEDKQIYIDFSGLHEVENEDSGPDKISEITEESSISIIKKTENKQTNTSEETFYEENVTKKDLLNIQEVKIGDTNFSTKKIIKEISFRDQIDGIRYALKLNIPYLISVVKKGVNKETKDLVKEHLRERLSDEEYEKVDALVHKYLYLIE